MSLAVTVELIRLEAGKHGGQTFVSSFDHPPNPSVKVLMCLGVSPYDSELILQADCLMLELHMKQDK